MPATWVSAHISEETKVRLDRFVRRTGQDRARTDQPTPGGLPIQPKASASRLTSRRNRAALYWAS